MDENTVFKTSASASFQSLGDGAVVLMADSGQLYSGNATMEAFLAKIDGKRTFGAIVDVLTDEFDIDRTSLASDMAALAEELVAEGIIEEAGGLK